MKKKIFAAVFFAFVFSALLCVSVSAFQVRQGQYDKYVYAPGVYDISAWTDAEDPVYQWCARVGTGGSASDYVELENDEKWSGVNTPHLSLITNDGLEYGTGWEDVYFCCRVTDKNGKTRYGPDINMVVFTHASLLDKLEREDVNYRDHGISYQGGGGPSLVSETDEYKRYESYGDKGLIPHTRTGTLDSDLQMTSEVSYKNEVYVTYDGKTVLFDGALNGFVPKKYGKGAVIFDYHLVLYVNGVKMETLDQRRSVVDVTVPAPIGYGATVNETPVYEQQYTQSRILTRVAKNKYIALLEEIGGYYKVAADGFFGYVPKGALNVGEKITAVGLDLSEPSEYAEAEFSASIYDMTSYTLYKTEPITWYDETSGRFLQSGDKFMPGHSYTLSVWLSAKAGKRFPLKNNDPDVYAEINGKTVKVNKAYEQDPEEVIALTYTFTHVHDPKKVDQINPTCTTPGKAVFYRCSCGAEYEDHTGRVLITDENWGYIPPIGHKESEWKTDGTSHYKFCLRRECGQEIPGTRGAHTGGSATCTHGKYCAVCGLEYGSKASHEWSSDWSYKDETGHARRCVNLCGQRTQTEPHVPGPKATSTEPQVCTVCGYIISPATNHKHELEKTEKVEPTCTSGGYSEYYVCGGCGKLFSDENGTEEITLDAVTLPALGHEESTDWKYNGEIHWKVCSRCGVTIADSEHEHVYKDGNDSCGECGYVKGTEADPGETSPAPRETEEIETERAVTETEKPEESSEKSYVLYIILIALGAAVIGSLGALAVIKMRKRKNGNNDE